MTKKNQIVIASTVLIVLLLSGLFFSIDSTSKYLKEISTDKSKNRVEFLENRVRELNAKIEQLEDSLSISIEKESIIVQEKIVIKKIYENQLKDIDNISASKLDSTFSSRFNK